MRPVSNLACLASAADSNCLLQELAMSEKLMPDPEMSPAQRELVASLTQDSVAKIDASLLSNAAPFDKKVAMIIGLTMMDKSVHIKGIPDLFYRDRVKSLIERGLLVADCELVSMGRCHVRLAL
jgi:hypothetical protein